MRLPLFPLNTVFFPGMLLPLHIFEARYREMINYCLDGRHPFGIVLIKSGAEVGAPAVPHPIGTYGTVSRVERLPDGRMNIEVIGQERFRLKSLHHDHTYLTGTVEDFPLQGCETVTANLARQALMPLLQRYLNLLSAAAKTEFDSQQLPHDPASIAYLAAIIAQIPLEEKQQLLTLDDATWLLEKECDIYRREVSLLRVMLTDRFTHENPNFSPN
jgi:Lon protease-like protein